MQKGVQLQGPLASGSAPGPRWGSTPGTRYRFAPPYVARTLALDPPLTKVVL